MGRALAIVGFRLRSRLREPGNLAVAALALAALLLAVLLPGAGGSGDAASAVTNALLVVGILAGLQAAAGGGALPADRTDGRGEWLSTLAPSRALQRAGIVGAGIVIPIVAGVVAAAIVAAVLVVSGRPVPTRTVTRLAVTHRVDGSYLESKRIGSVLTSEIDLGRESNAAARSVELDIRPVYRDISAASATEIRGILFSSSGFGMALPTGKEWFPARGSFTVVAEPHVAFLVLGSSDPRVDLRVTGARTLGDEKSFTLNLLLAGLLLGLAAACVAPVAVLASRATSAPTAALLAGVVMLLGIAKAPLLELAGDIGNVGGGAIAAGILRGAAFVSPDLSTVSSLSDVAAGRALTLSTFAALGPAAVYAVIVAAVAVVVPQRKGAR